MSSAAKNLINLKSYRNKNLKEYSIMLEYKALKDAPPVGVYLMPSSDNSHMFYGVIFLEKGLYKGGVFKFTLALPDDYPAEGSIPKLLFQSHVFHPRVNPTTHALDLDVQFKDWQPSNPNHNIHTVMRYVKYIFYLKDFAQPSRSSNPKALQLVEKDRSRYLEHVQECVQTSIDRCYKNDSGSTIRFSQYSKQHDIHRTVILQSLIDQGVDSRVMRNPNEEKTSPKEES